MEGFCYGCFRRLDAAGRCGCGFDPAADRAAHPMALPLGTRLNGRYIVGKVLIQEDAAIVYTALDIAGRTAVSVKEYLPRGLVSRRAPDTAVQVQPGKEEIFALEKGYFLEAERNTEAAGGCDCFEQNGTAYFVPASSRRAVPQDSLSPVKKRRKGRWMVPVFLVLGIITIGGIVGIASAASAKKQTEQKPAYTAATTTRATTRATTTAATTTAATTRATTRATTTAATTTEAVWTEPPEVSGWKAELTYFNADPENKTDILSTVCAADFGSYLQFGFRVSGGAEGETVTLGHTVLYPDGTEKTTDWNWENCASGETHGAHWENGFTVTEYGIYTVEIFVAETGEVIGVFSCVLTEEPAEASGWRAELTYFNADTENETDILPVVRAADFGSYLHYGFTLSGGAEGETVTLHHTVLYPDGTEKTADWLWEDISNGTICWASWENGFTVTEYGVYTFEVSVVETGEVIGVFSVLLTP